MLKVFAMDDYVWYAAETLEDALGQYSKDTGISIQELKENGDAGEVSEAQMKELKFYPEYPHTKDAPSMTFAERLQEMIDKGAIFPCFFATTEW